MHLWNQPSRAVFGLPTLVQNHARLAHVPSFIYTFSMTSRTPYMASTRGIAVSVEPTYLETRSSPDASQYVWAYRVIIENQGRETVQLLSRHWMISNSRGELTEVKGPGVVGNQPVLKPGESFEYTSGAPLDTPSGMMGGAYQMETESGERFDIEIPTFSLDRPNQGTLLN